MEHYSWITRTRLIWQGSCQKRITYTFPERQLQWWKFLNEIGRIRLVPNQISEEDTPRSKSSHEQAINCGREQFCMKLGNLIKAQFQECFTPIEETFKWWTVEELISPFWLIGLLFCRWLISEAISSGVYEMTRPDQMVIERCFCLLMVVSCPGIVFNSPTRLVCSPIKVPSAAQIS